MRRDASCAKGDKWAAASRGRHIWSPSLSRCPSLLLLLPSMLVLLTSLLPALSSFCLSFVYPAKSSVRSMEVTERSAAPMTAMNASSCAFAQQAPACWEG